MQWRLGGFSMTGLRYKINMAVNLALDLSMQYILIESLGH